MKRFSFFIPLAGAISLLCHCHTQLCVAYSHLPYFRDLRAECQGNEFVPGDVKVVKIVDFTREEKKE